MNTEENSTLQRIGQLYERRSQMSMTRTVRQARLMFYSNPHLAGLEPVECRVHPDHLKELPAGVDGLLVVGDETTKLGHVFVCCPDPEVAYA